MSKNFVTRNTKRVVRDPSFVPERSVEKLTAKRKIEFPPPTHQKINFFQFFFDGRLKEKLKKVDFLMNRGGGLNFSCFFAFRLRSEQEPCFDQNPENRNKTAACSLVLPSCPELLNFG